MAPRALLLISSFIGAILISSISGTQYLFAAYGPALAHRLHFSSVQINTIASAANYGCYLSNPLFGHISDKYGPKITTLFASVTLFFSFLGLASTYHGILPPLFSLCVICLFLTGMASAAGFMAVLTTQAKNFPAIRGIALGIPLALFGLSAFIFSTIESWFFGDQTYRFLVFLAISTSLCNLVGCAALNVVAQPSTQSSNEVPEAPTTNVQQSESIDTEQTPLLFKNIKKQEQQQENNDNKDELNISGSDLLRNSDAQNLFFILLLTGGVGLMYINNVGSILRSLFDTTLMFDDHEKLLKYQNFHVSLISVFSCIGRVSSGFISDLTKQTFNLRRIWFMLSASILLLSGQIIVGFFATHLETLWIGSMLIGLGFGNLLGIAPTIASEWFGLRRFGLNCPSQSADNSAVSYSDSIGICNAINALAQIAILMFSGSHLPLVY
ncbi:8291_t:CDS:2 [Ambispora gerdemannii]|uniref:8291_t:CDS:1 n=1 Tax=Ambispora gerdemannii TaxID=144530 RepID=A0A9N8Z8E2_9GLOM|nr:8291_t:CDS:2 [Ambispora gerdemannii]